MTDAGAAASERWGLTLPLDTVPLVELPTVALEMARLGYTDFWSSEVDATDGLTPLAAIAGSGVDSFLGTAILPVYTRGPAVLAQSAATMAGLAPGRFALGIGASSPAVVRAWNAVGHDLPYARVRDTLAFLREALAGGRVDRSFETFAVHGFRLARPPEQPPPLLVAALRPQMLRLAVHRGDGAITNWLSATDVRQVREVIGPTALLVARILVCPSTDTERVRAFGRRLIAGYLTVAAYADFQRWLGRGPALVRMWELWSAGDRRGALAAIPDQVVDDLIVHGTPDECVRHIRRYADGGVTVPVTFLLPAEGEARAAAAALSPSSQGNAARGW